MNKIQNGIIDELINDLDSYFKIAQKRSSLIFYRLMIWYGAFMFIFFTFIISFVWYSFIFSIMILLVARYSVRIIDIELKKETK